MNKMQRILLISSISFFVVVSSLVLAQSSGDGYIYNGKQLVYEVQDFRDWFLSYTLSSPIEVETNEFIVEKNRDYIRVTSNLVCSPQFYLVSEKFTGFDIEPGFIVIIELKTSEVITGYKLNFHLRGYRPASGPSGSICVAEVFSDTTRLEKETLYEFPVERFSLNIDASGFCPDLGEKFSGLYTGEYIEITSLRIYG
jgi:hypothetical protein